MMAGRLIRPWQILMKFASKGPRAVSDGRPESRIDEIFVTHRHRQTALAPPSLPPSLLPLLYRALSDSSVLYRSMVR
jgi:hypothetical protein